MRLQNITEDRPLFVSRRVWSDGVSPIISVRFDSQVRHFRFANQDIADRLWRYARYAPGKAWQKLRGLLADGVAEELGDTKQRRLF